MNKILLIVMATFITSNVVAAPNCANGTKYNYVKGGCESKNTSRTGGQSNYQTSTRQCSNGYNYNLRTRSCDKIPEPTYNRTQGPIGCAEGFHYNSGSGHCVKSRVQPKKLYDETKR